MNLLTNNNELREFINKINPFLIRDDTGNLLVFKDYGECYLYTLKFLRDKFKRGFIDVPLAVYLLTRVSPNDARRIAKKLPFLILASEIYLCPWEDKKSNPKFKAEQIMRALHSLSDTKFSTDFFNWAWDEFMKFVEQNKI